ncbi:MAG: NAD(P)/FAD-dependent oxidoreductase [Bryobacterales bacterium]|nr:NAD(P)/FAD-dependent oxidoreductase [Bryobacterales bacterium]MBV9401834.1 NAD(P)/FAD-dependent oxidoreductase [Bryobacterales bacterium]
MHRVVIVGGGFGGLAAAKAIRYAPVEVTVVDRRNFHLFQPLLYQVATGSLSPSEIATPLRTLVRNQKNVRVAMDEAVYLDTKNRRLVLSSETIPYDSLIVATGAQNHFFGHGEWEQSAPGLKTIEDATRIRHKILEAFEKAELERDPDARRAWLTFVLVGGGATGVELAGALAEIANDTLRDDFRSIRPEESQILLLEGADRLLQSFPEDLSKAAEQSLARLGVQVRTRVRVTAIDADGVTLSSQQRPETIASKTVIWAAGVAPSDFTGIVARATGAATDRAGRICVQSDLTVSGYPEIFVIGDAAHLEWKGAPLPGIAPVAMQQGRQAAEAIMERLRGYPAPEFRYRNKGNLAVIGRNAAVADFGRLRFHGRPAWLLWLFVHLMYLAEFRNRLIVFIRWGFSYLTFDRGARLITGAADAPASAARR